MLIRVAKPHPSLAHLVGKVGYVEQSWGDPPNLWCKLPYVSSVCDFPDYGMGFRLEEVQKISVFAFLFGWIRQFVSYRPIQRKRGK